MTATTDWLKTLIPEGSYVGQWTETGKLVAAIYERLYGRWPTDVGYWPTECGEPYTRDDLDLIGDALTSLYQAAPARRDEIKDLLRRHRELELDGSGN